MNSDKAGLPERETGASRPNVFDDAMRAGMRTAAGAMGGLVCFNAGNAYARLRIDTAGEALLRFAVVLTLSLLLAFLAGATWRVLSRIRLSDAFPDKAQVGKPQSAAPSNPHGIDP